MKKGKKWEKKKKMLGGRALLDLENGWEEHLSRDWTVMRIERKV